MNVIDKAHELSRAIKESDEFKAYSKLKSVVDSNESLKTMITDFHTKQFELQKQQLMSGNVDQNELSKLQELYAIVTKDPVAADFLSAEMRFSQVMADVSKILEDILK